MKTPKKMKSKATLRQVVKKALEDKKFLNSLIANSKDPKRFLDSKGLSLPEAELKNLKTSLQSTYKIKGHDLLNLISCFNPRIAKTGPPPWPIYVQMLLKHEHGHRPKDIPEIGKGPGKPDR